MLALCDFAGLLCLLSVNVGLLSVKEREAVSLTSPLSDVIYLNELVFLLNRLN